LAGVELSGSAIEKVKTIRRLTSARQLSACVLWVLGLLAAVAFLPILLWGVYLFPIGDDLECASWAPGWDALYEVPWALWHTWGGCYSAIFFRALYAPLTRQGVFWVTPLVFVALHVIGGAIGIWFWRRGSKLTAVFVASIWTLIYFATMPLPAETTFWATGMLVYEPGNVLTLILTALAFNPQPITRGNRLQTALIWIMIPIIVGCHFTFSLWTISMMALRMYERGGKVQDVGLFIWCLVFVGLVFAAPGNFQRYTVRMEDVATTVSVGYVVTRSLGSFFEFVTRELSLVQNWLWVLLGTGLTFRQVSNNHERPTVATLITRMSAVLLPLLGIFVLSAMTREVPPPARTLNALHYLFITGIVFLVIPVVTTLLSVEGCFRDWLTEKGVFEKVTGLSLCFAIVSPNYVRCVRELITAAPEYRQYWYEVEKQVAEAKRKGLQRVEIAADPQRRPITVFHPSFLTPDPQAWPNRHYADYFGIGEVVAIERTP